MINSHVSLERLKSRVPPSLAMKPNWDINARMLFFKRTLVIAFGRPAQNQELLLASFEEQSWLESIDLHVTGFPPGITKRATQNYNFEAFVSNRLSESGREP